MPEAPGLRKMTQKYTTSLFRHLPLYEFLGEIVMTERVYSFVLHSPRLGRVGDVVRHNTHYR